MKEIRTEEAVGLVLVHDITRIIKDEVKDTPFRKGHIIQKEDVPVLLSLGKDHVFVFTDEDGDLVHENEAALRLSSFIKGPGLSESEVKEGKIELRSLYDGVFFNDTEKLMRLNMIDKMSASSVNTARRVSKGEHVMGFRVIPLMIERSYLEEAEKIGGPIAEVREIRKKNFALITTGNEVYNKRIKDTFTPVIIEKMSQYGSAMVSHTVLPDDDKAITRAILEAKEKADIILITGGMSVDPDDRTPLAIRNSGADIISYGSPVLPGSMLLVSYLDGKPLLGLPGCVMYNKRTVFDLVLPFVFTDKRITKKYLSSLSGTGFCTSCNPCIWPSCHFGKGGISEL